VVGVSGPEGKPQLTSTVPSNVENKRMVSGTTITGKEPGDEWKKILRRRAFSPRKDAVHGSDRHDNPAFELATRNLSKENRERISGQKERTNRYEHLENESPDEDSDYFDAKNSAGEGPSNPKGKGADPRNWGGIDLNKDELDVAKQKAAFDSYHVRRKKHTKNTSKKSRGVDKVRYVTPTTDISRSEIVEKTRKDYRAKKHAAGVRPVMQIPEDSYLGAAFKQVKNSEKKRKRKNLPA
jgi:hypothetical protein